MKEFARVVVGFLVVACIVSVFGAFLLFAYPQVFSAYTPTAKVEARQPQATPILVRTYAAPVGTETAEPTAQPTVDYQSKNAALQSTIDANNRLLVAVTQEHEKRLMVAAGYTKSVYDLNNTQAAASATARPVSGTATKAREIILDAQVDAENTTVSIEATQIKERPTDIVNLSNAATVAKTSEPRAWAFIALIVALVVLLSGLGVWWWGQGLWHAANAQRITAPQQAPKRITDDRPMTKSEGVDTFLADFSPPGDEEKFRTWADWAIALYPLGKETHKLRVRIYGQAEYAPVWAWLKAHPQWLLSEKETKNNELALNPIGVIKFTEWCCWYDGADVYAPLKDWSKEASEEIKPVTPPFPTQPESQKQAILPDGKPLDGTLDGGEVVADEESEEK